MAKMEGAQLAGRSEFESREVEVKVAQASGFSRSLASSAKQSSSRYLRPSFNNLHLLTLTSNLITMFRTALVRSARCIAQASTRAPRPAIRRAALASPFTQSRISSPVVQLAAVRGYASSSGLGQEEVTGRILDLLKNFDKVCLKMQFWKVLGELG
jgi:hypothetical protein